MGTHITVSNIIEHVYMESFYYCIYLRVMMAKKDCLTENITVIRMLTISITLFNNLL